MGEQDRPAFFDAASAVLSPDSMRWMLFMIPDTAPHCLRDATETIVRQSGWHRLLL